MSFTSDVRISHEKESVVVAGACGSCVVQRRDSLADPVFLLSAVACRGPSGIRGILPILAAEHKERCSPSLCAHRSRFALAPNHGAVRVPALDALSRPRAPVGGRIREIVPALPA